MARHATHAGASSSRSSPSMEYLHRATFAQALMDRTWLKEKEAKALFEQITGTVNGGSQCAIYPLCICEVIGDIVHRFARKHGSYVASGTCADFADDATCWCVLCRPGVHEHVRRCGQGALHLQLQACQAAIPSERPPIDGIRTAHL